MTTCPACNGAMRVPAFADGRDADGKAWGAVREVPCITCNGRGTVTEEDQAAMSRGQVLRDERVRQRLSLFDAALQYGMTPAQLSRIERGHGPPGALNGRGLFPDLEAAFPDLEAALQAKVHEVLSHPMAVHIQPDPDDPTKLIKTILHGPPVEDPAARLELPHTLSAGEAAPALGDELPATVSGWRPGDPPP